MEPPKNAPASGSGDSGLNLRGFNQVGRDDAAREVLKPKRDPAATRRAALLGAVVFFAFCVLGYLVFLRSGRALFSPPATERAFEPPPAQPDAAGQ